MKTRVFVRSCFYFEPSYERVCLRFLFQPKTTHHCPKPTTTFQPNATALRTRIIVNYLCIANNICIYNIYSLCNINICNINISILYVFTIVARSLKHFFIMIL
jgi:hypothetical protein